MRNIACAILFILCILPLHAFGQMESAKNIRAINEILADVFSNRYDDAAEKSEQTFRKDDYLWYVSFIGMIAGREASYDHDKALSRFYYLIQESKDIRQTYSDSQKEKDLVRISSALLDDMDLIIHEFDLKQPLDTTTVKMLWNTAIFVNRLYFQVMSTKLSGSNMQEVLGSEQNFKYKYNYIFDLYKAARRVLPTAGKNSIVNDWFCYNMDYECAFSFPHHSTVYFDALQEKLKPEEVILKIIHLPSLPTEDDSYEAFIIPHRGQLVSVPFKFNRSDYLYAFIDDSTSEKEKIEYIYKWSYGLFYNDMWKLILARCKEAKVFYVDDGDDLANINIDAIHLQNNPTVFFSDRYHIVKLKSLSDIIVKRNTYRPRDLVIFGDINFYDKNKKAVPQLKRITTRYDKLVRLPYSRVEVDGIADLCKAHRIKEKLYANINATEKAFKAMSGHSPQIIHISSHAYNLNFTYGAEPEKKKYEDDEGSSLILEIGKDYTENDMILMYGKDQITSHIDPMKRNQGLFLAGAGPKWNDRNYAIPDNANDGILMAKEIENLDFRKTDLVVLSACDTGWNKDNISLARSFLTAGAQTVIMSLWLVDDKVTAEFMISFYKHWIQCGDKLKAFKDCQTDIRKKYPSPYYWAAFVMMI
jgi:hypothetical protein